MIDTAPIDPLEDRQTLTPDVAATAEAIVQAGLWCVVETRASIDGERWQPRLMICRDDESGIAAAIDEWRRGCPDAEAQIAGYTRDTLRRSDIAVTLGS